MPFQKLEFRPGIFRDATDYTNTGGWYDCNNIRFRAGKPEKIRENISLFIKALKVIIAKLNERLRLAFP